MNISNNSPIISIIVCVASNGVIGNKGVMPWKNSEDMKFFKEKTIHHPVIMGRKTFQSIGSPLKDRHNVVITSNEEMYDRVPDNAFGPLYVGSLTDAIDSVDHLSNEIFIIGGASIYDEAIKNGLVDRMYINVLNEKYEGDTKFPYYTEKDWNITQSTETYKTFKSYILIKKSYI